jgi:hypothetical protein
MHLRIASCRVQQVPIEPLVELLVAHQRQVQHIRDRDEPGDEGPTEEKIRNTLPRLVQVELVATHSTEEEGEKESVGLCLHAERVWVRVRVNDTILRRTVTLGMIRLRIEATAVQQAGS